MKRGQIQCKDIPDEPILHYLAQHGRVMRFHPRLGPSVVEAMPEGISERLVLAKMASMIRRGLVDGCACGCRGDFEITDKGRKVRMAGLGGIDRSKPMREIYSVRNHAP
jgi:hypothetical protein